MEDGLLSLKWNNHRSTFFHILSEVRCKQTYTDATLACEGKFFPVHKLVMSTCSDYFAEIFEKTPCKNPVVVLKDIKKSDLEALLDYMYIGEVDVRQSELAGLIKAAECLRIKGLAVPDEDPTKAQKKGPPAVPERREDSPPAKRKRRDSGGRAPSPPLHRGSSHSHHSQSSSHSHTSTAPVPSQAPPSSSNVPESHVPSHPMPPPPHLAQEAGGRARSDALPSSHHHHHPQLSVGRGAADSLRSPPGTATDTPHGAGASGRGPDPSMVVVPRIKVEVDEGGEGGGGGKDGAGEEGSELDDNDEDGSNDFTEYQGHVGDIEKEEHDQVDSYSTDQLPGPSGLQGAPPVLSWSEEGEGGFPHNLFGGDDPAAQQAGRGGAALMEEVPLPLPTFLTRLGLPAAPHAPTHALHALEAAELELGARRHQCGVCGRGFRLANDLRRHLRTHTGEKPFLCPHCPYRASQKQSVNRHVRTVHSHLFLTEDPPLASLSRASLAQSSALANAAAAAAAAAPRLAAAFPHARIDKL